MAFDVQPQDVVQTDDFLEARFQTPGLNLTSGPLTLAQMVVPPVVMSYAGGPATFIMPQYPNGKFTSVRLVVTPIAVFTNTAGLAGPATITNAVQYLGWGGGGGTSFTFDGINRNPEVTVRKEELLLPFRALRILELTSIQVSFSLNMTDLWMPTVGADQIFRPEPVGAVHQVQANAQLFVKVYYK